MLVLFMGGEKKHRKKEEAPGNLPWKDEKAMASQMTVSELFPRQYWGSFFDTGAEHKWEFLTT